MSDGVDIVVTLHALATYAENANHWTDDKRMMDASGVADTIYEAMDRIEELEAKLAKAVEALELYSCDDGCNDCPEHERDRVTCGWTASVALAAIKEAE